MKRTSIAVLYGGRSPEHPVSCVSAGAVMSRLDPERYEVVPVGITDTGVWTLGDGDVSRLRISGRTMPRVDADRPRVALSLDTEDRGVLRAVDGPEAGSVVARVDVVLPMLHGPFGEDGTVQGLLELSGLPYVGPGVFAGSAAMDKEFTKIVLGACGLPVGTQVVLRPGVEGPTGQERELLGLPVFVKPARGGSSIGISRVLRWEDLPAAIAVAREHDAKVILESAIVGREVECAVLEFDDGRVEASLPAEIHMPAEHAAADDGVDDGTADGAFYDFDTKYLDDVCTFDLPAELGAETTARIRELAVRAFRALDCAGLSRVDFFVTEDGPVINEVNTLPGFTPISMYPQMWEATGLGYTELLDQLIATALAG